MSIKCLASGRFFSGFPLPGSRHEPQEHRGLEGERTGQVGQARRGQLDIGRRRRPLSPASAAGALAGGLALRARPGSSNLRRQ